MRTSESDVKNAIERLNSISNRKYVPNFAYGRYGLQVIADASTGAVNDCLPLLTKQGLYDAIWGIIKYIQHENQDRQIKTT